MLQKGKGYHQGTRTVKTLSVKIQKEVSYVGIAEKKEKPYAR